MKFDMFAGSVWKRDENQSLNIHGLCQPRFSITLHFISIRTQYTINNTNVCLISNVFGLCLCHFGQYIVYFVIIRCIFEISIQLKHSILNVNFNVSLAKQYGSEQYPHFMLHCTLDYISIKSKLML